MAKLTEAQLKTLCATYVDAAKQAGAWSASTNNLYGLLDKVGKQVSLDGLFADKMPEMDGEELPLGKTIEEYFADLILAEDFDGGIDGQNYTRALAPAKISTESPSYSYTLGRKVLRVTEPYNNVERAALTTADASNMLTKITKRLYDSEAVFKYAQKRQLLANMIAKAEAATNASTLVKTLAVPTNQTTSEAFIKDIKETAEIASDINTGHNLANCLIGAAPSLILYVKQGVVPTLEVDAMAGAFNQERLAMPVEIRVIKDFGNNATGVYAMLVDPRGAKIHPDYKAVRTDENGYEDFITFNLHTESTAFISKFTFLKVYKG